MRSGAECLLYYGVLPLWGAGALADWWLHRATRIEAPGHGGVREATLHLVLLGESGVSVALAVLCEASPAVVALCGSAAVAHEVTAAIDLGVALGSERRVGRAELGVHTLLGVLPVALVALLGVSARSSHRGRRCGHERWTVQPKAEPLGRRVLVGGALWSLLSAVLPYSEELHRCRAAADLSRRATARQARRRPPKGGTEGAAPQANSLCWVQR